MIPDPVFDDNTRCARPAGQACAYVARGLISAVAIALLTACGGGGGGSAGSVDEVVEIAERGFANEGIFSGVRGSTEVLLILDGGEFFLLSGDLASQGTYSVSSVDFEAQGRAYRITADNQPIGDLTMTGTYRTDRHLDLTWTEVTTGRQESLIIEATNVYFEHAPLDNVIGAWINQDEGNLLFLSISQNLGPVAGDDYVVAEPAATIDIPVLANDRDPDGDPLRIVSVDETTRRGAVATIEDSGTPDDFSDDVLRYTVPDGFDTGVDRVGYVIEDPEEGSDRAEAVITVPVVAGDLSVTAESSTAAPAAGDAITVTIEITSFVDTGVTAQLRYVIPDGLRFVTQSAVVRAPAAEGINARAYDAATGFWAPDLPANGTGTLTLDLLVDDYGDFDSEVEIVGASIMLTNTVDDSTAFVLSPTGLTPPPDLPPAANVEGIILSSLTQIQGQIREHRAANNAYAMRIELGAGGLGGGGATQVFLGYAVLGEEEVEVAVDAGDGSDDGSAGGDGTDDGTGDDGSSDDSGDGAVDDETPPETEIRTTMLILTANETGVFLNKLFFVREDELQDSARPAVQAGRQ